jgi:GH15 family glucan-1,4-alpha-glucosidase
MSYQPIENYGIIGNMRTVALVGMNGSIDWYCYPHFDSPSVFGAIVDDKKGGRFQISADTDGVRHKQFYWPSTNVLVTRFLMADGIAELEDFMPVALSSESSAYRRLSSHSLRQGNGAHFGHLPPSLRLRTTDARGADRN